MLLDIWSDVDGTDEKVHTKMSYFNVCQPQYEKTPKKCRQLTDVISDMKDSLTFDDAGTKPVGVSGSRWVSHKLNAMKRILLIMVLTQTILQHCQTKQGVLTDPNLMGITRGGWMENISWDVLCS